MRQTAWGEDKHAQPPRKGNKKLMPIFYPVSGDGDPTRSRLSFSLVSVPEARIVSCDTLQALSAVIQFEKHIEMVRKAVAAFNEDPRFTAVDAKWVDVVLVYWGKRKWAVAGEDATVCYDDGPAGARTYQSSRAVEAKRRAERAAARGGANEKK